MFEYSGKGDLGGIDFAQLPAPKVPFGVRLFNGKKGLDAALKSLAGVKNLQVLSVFDCAATEKEWQALGGFKQLTILDVKGGYQRGTRPPESALKLLKNCKSLNTLSITGMRLTEVGVKSLAEFKQVHRLGARDTALTDALLKELKGMETLKELDLSWTPITDTGVGVLLEFKNLTALDLAETQISDACLKDVRRFPKLKSLNLNYTKITDTGLDALGTAKNLKTLSLSGIKASEMGLGRLRKALPGCKVKN